MISGRTKMKNEINTIGLGVLNLQIKALKKLRSSINQSFEEAVKTIQKCKSKVVICGVGKSGLIASKISATLSSVGTPSFSVSASDCSHGDLGRITNKDILDFIFRTLIDDNCSMKKSIKLENWMDVVIDVLSRALDLVKGIQNIDNR